VRIVFASESKKCMQSLDDSLQLRVHRLGLLQDTNVGVGIWTIGLEGVIPNVAVLHAE
jgi:hypothetical protein